MRSHLNSNTYSLVILLSIYQYFILLDDGQFQPQHVVSRFLIYTINILSWDWWHFLSIIAHYHNGTNEVADCLNYMLPNT